MTVNGLADQTEPPPPSPIVIRSIRSSQQNESWNWSNLQRPFFRMYANQQAGAELRYQGERYPLLPGEVMLVPAWFPFSAHCEGTVEHLSVHFELDQELVHPIQQLRPFVMALQPAYKKSLRHLTVDLRQRPPHNGDGYTIMAFISQLLATAHRHNELWCQLLDGAKAPNSPLAQACITYAAQLPALNHGVSHMAKQVSVSVSHLRRHLQQQLGMSPQELINRYRVRKACLLLQQGQIDLLRVAENCGFSDRNYFSRWFRKHLAVSPRDYRAGLYSLRGPK